MTNVFGVFGPQSFIVLVIAVIGVIPIALYYKKTPNVLVIPYVFLFVAAFATNFEDLFLGELLNLTEHVVGNMGAGVAFAVGAYVYRQRSISVDEETAESTKQSGGDP